MVRFFIIVAEVILLVVVLRSPFVQYFLSDVHHAVSGWFRQLHQLPEKRELDAFRQDVKTTLAPLKTFQKAYLQQITTSKVSLIHFDRQYCVGNDINPNFEGNERRQLCALIEQSSLVNVQP